MSEESSSYTIKNLTETKDSAPEHGLADTCEAYFATDELDAERTGFSLQIIKPDQRQTFGHVHEEAEEVYVVVAGSGRVKLDDEIAELG